MSGASSGIGEAAAIALAEAGASVAVGARRADRLERLVRRIETADGKAIALPGAAPHRSFGGRIDISEIFARRVRRNESMLGRLC